MSTVLLLAVKRGVMIICATHFNGSENLILTTSIRNIPEDQLEGSQGCSAYAQ